jgi:complex III assembly factor LYRM7
VFCPFSLKPPNRQLLGDYHLLHAARQQAREGFNNLRSAKATSDEATKGIAHAEEVAKLLRHNIVQGQKVEGKEALR